LQAWDANPSFDFEFDSRGPNVAISSDEAAVVKQSLTRMMKSAFGSSFQMAGECSIPTLILTGLPRAAGVSFGLMLRAARMSFKRR